MKVLHLGTGYPPITGGGLTLYTMGLMRAQAVAGHSVHYLCVGTFDLLFATRLTQWDNGDVHVHEVRNPRSDSIHLGRIDRVRVDRADVRTEELVRDVLAKVRPDVVHIQSLLGWPASVIKVIRGMRVPTVMTVQNFQGLCPTTRLYDEVAGEVCDDFAEGRRCVRCNKVRPRAVKLRNLQRLRSAWAGEALLRNVTCVLRAARGLRARAGRRVAAPVPCALGPMTAASEAFRERRQAFVGAFNSVNRIAAMSGRVAELLVGCGVDPSRVSTLALVLGDLGDIERKPARTPSRPVRFGLLNKLTHLKGADLLRLAFSGLNADLAKLLVFGQQVGTSAAALRPLVERGVVELRGPYRRGDLGAILREVDVGVVPSIWEEPYGYAGIEFLAAGVPVLGSRIGGIPDYVEDGVNGLLLPPGDANAWRAAIIRLASDPCEVGRLARGIRAIKSMQQHLGEVEELYCAAVSGVHSP